MLDLRVQAAEQPGHHAAAPGKVHGRLCLMDRPVIFMRQLSRVGQRKIGLHSDVGELEDDANRPPFCPRGVRKSNRFHHK